VLGWGGRLLAVGGQCEEGHTAHSPAGNAIMVFAGGPGGQP
jgi:hypothetical protein